MTPNTKRLASAVLMLVGTIVGVGIFGVPYAIAQVGLIPALILFVVLGAIQLLQHLFFAEAAIASQEPSRLPGLVRRYVSPRAGRLAGVAMMLTLWSGMVAYLILGGAFLHTIFNPWLGGSVFVYQALWAVVGALIIWGGLKSVVSADLIGTVALMAALAVVLVVVAPKVSLANFQSFHFGDIFLPYGIILFSLNGISVIPEMEDVFHGRHEHYRLAVVIGTLLAWALTLAFGLMVYGLSGAATAEDAIVGLRSILGDRIILSLAAFGFLAVATSFLPSALAMHNSWKNDLGQSRLAAWSLTILPPVIVWLLGIRSFVSVISFSGAVFGGVVAVLVSLLYIAIVRQRLVKDRPLGLSVRWAYLSIFILSVGALVEIIYSARKLFL